ncbi:hypothetical protein HV077_19975 [Citrobacter freundii]|uniref:Uncharacterized protein n=1 Tax=Citrobacter freundii TaxID=546 RepID=A0A7W3D7U6_CITFR|nr:hypothetical protein [Citrobacter freundii]MBA8064617.1 hypothetical protein [Citrobacter freundii]
MTTTIYDGLKRVVGSDSRWSCFAKHDNNDYKLCSHSEATHVVYVDDTGFGKILLRQDVVLCLAGNGALIEQWKRWWRADVVVKNYPPFTTPEGGVVAIYAVDLRNNQVCLLSKQIDCSYVDPTSREVLALFSGTGGTLAFQAWRTTMDVKQSILSAISSDCYSGGCVRFIDYPQQQQDIEDSYHTINDVNNELINRGFVMEINNVKNMIPITNECFSSMRNELTGNVSAIEAPLGVAANVVWDEPALARLDALVDMMTEREREQG